MATTQQEQALQKRLARYNANSTPNTTDLTQVHQSPIVKTTAAAHQASQRTFSLFLQIKGMPLFENLFSYGSPPPTAALLKEFLIFYSQSSKGTLDTETQKVTVWTVLSAFRVLSGMFSRRTGHIISRPVRKDVSAFVLTDLKQKEGLSMARRVKPLFDKHDLDNLLAALFDRNTLGGFENMRNLLNLCLFMSLYLDCAARGADIAYSAAAAESVEECLLWEDIEVIVFPKEGAGVEVRANVTIKWMKGMRNRPDLWKVVPLHLLSPHLASQDTLRLLMVLGFIDGVFVGVKDWAVLKSLEPKRDGSRIQIKPAALKIPIFRRMNMKSRKINDTPLPRDSLSIEVGRAGEATGFEKRLTPYGLRRGMGYMLDINCDKGTRKFVMGHVPGSKVWASYQSRVVTVDTAHIFREEDQVSSRPLMRMSLNRSEEGRQPLSKEGYDQVLHDPSLVALNKEVQDMKATILTDHKSLNEAKRAKHHLSAQYTKLARAYHRQRDTLIKKESRTEHIQRCQAGVVPADQPFAESTAEGDVSSTVIPSVGNPSPVESSIANRSVADPSFDDPSFDDPSFDDPSFDDPSFDDPSFDDPSFDDPSFDDPSFDDPSFDDPSFDDPSFDDPSFDNLSFTDLLFNNHSFNDPSLDISLSSGEKINDILDQIDLEIPTIDEDPDSLPANADQNHIDPNHRLHSLQPRLATALPSTTEYRHFRSFVGSGECQSLWEHLSQGQLSDEELSAKMVHAFNVRHTIDFFEPGEEPPNGTFDCRFCKVDMSTLTGKRSNAPYYGHAHDCAGKEAQSRSGKEKVRFCFFCQTWLVAMKKDEMDDHFESHEPEAWRMIREIGYEGVVAGARMLRPRLCIYCFHDNDCSFTARLTNSSQAHRQNWFGHVQKVHLKKLKTIERHHCPAWPDMCALDKELSVDQLTEHLSVVHRVNASDAKARKRPSDVVEDVGSSNNSPKVQRVLATTDGNARPTSSGKERVT